MKNYISTLGKIMSRGWDENTKDYGPVRLLLGQQLRFVLGKGFPILTTREIDFDAVRDLAFQVLLCTNAEELVARIRDGVPGPRRLEFTGATGVPRAYDLFPAALQVVTEGNIVHFILNYDSIDFVVDLPQVIATYALIARLLVRQIGGHYCGELVVNFGRGYIRQEHFAAVNEQINRRAHKLPGVVINDERPTFRDMLTADGEPNIEDVKIEGYTHWDHIKL